MAVSNKAYGLFAKHLAMGHIPWKASAGASVKCALLLNTYEPSLDEDEVFGDVSAYEVSADGTGYTAGGVACALSDPTQGLGIVSLDLADAEWAELTLTARYAVFYAVSATAGERYLIALCDFGEDKAPSAEPFKVRVSVDGAIQLAASRI